MNEGFGGKCYAAILRREASLRRTLSAVGLLLCAVACGATQGSTNSEAAGGSGGAASVVVNGGSAGTVASDAAGGATSGGASGYSGAETSGASGEAGGRGGAGPDQAGGVAGSAGSSAGAGGVPPAAAWVGTWAASPQGCSVTYSSQTLRQIVHTSIGGDQARVQLSNAYGTTPLRVSDVHIADRASGSTIVAASDRLVTFGGKTSFDIAPGALAVSDAVTFSLAPLADVALSFYLPDSVVIRTCHITALQTSYIAAGDVSASPTLSNPSSTTDLFLLANLDVKTASARGAVVTFGASITDGVGSQNDTNRRWPNDLAQRLNEAASEVAVLNQGISGNKLLGGGESGLNRFQRDALTQPGAKWVIVSDDPINDLGAKTNPPTGEQLIAGLQQLIAQAHQAGLKYLCSTLTPFEGAGGWTAQGETAREQVNAFVRGAGSGCDGLVDQDTATHDPSQPTRYLASYDSGDHLHPSVAGLQAIANAVPLESFQ